MSQIRLLDFYEYAHSKLLNDKWFAFWGEGVVQNMEVTESTPKGLTVTIQAGATEDVKGWWTREGVLVEETQSIILPYPGYPGGVPQPNNHPTYDRLDLIVATYHWLPYAIGSGAPPTAYYQWVVGTPAANPVRPAIPPYSIPLGLIRMRPHSPPIENGDITERIS